MRSIQEALNYVLLQVGCPFKALYEMLKKEGCEVSEVTVRRWMEGTSPQRKTDEIPVRKLESKIDQWLKIENSDDSLLQQLIQQKLIREQQSATTTYSNVPSRSDTPQWYRTLSAQNSWLLEAVENGQLTTASPTVKAVVEARLDLFEQSLKAVIDDSLDATLPSPMRERIWVWMAFASVLRGKLKQALHFIERGLENFDRKVAAEESKQILATAAHVCIVLGLIEKAVEFSEVGLAIGSAVALSVNYIAALSDAAEIDPSRIQLLREFLVKFLKEYPTVRNPNSDLGRQLLVDNAWQRFRKSAVFVEFLPELACQLRKNESGGTGKMVLKLIPWVVVGAIFALCASRGLESVKSRPDMVVAMIGSIKESKDLRDSFR